MPARPLTTAIAIAALLGGAAALAQIEGGRGIAPIDSAGSYEVAGVTVDVAGKTAEAARFAGWRLAQRRAWGQLSRRLGGGGGLVSDGTLDQMVSGIVVEREQIGPTRYIARLGVLFNRARAGGLLGISAYADRSRPMLLVPLQVSGGVETVFERRNPWQEAWARFRTGNSAVDYIRPSGSGADSLLLNAGQIGRPGRGWWRTVIDQYGASDVLIPVVRLYRTYPGGPIVGVFEARHGPDNRFLASATLRVGSAAGLSQLLDAGVKRIDDIFQRALRGGMLGFDPSLAPLPEPTPEATDDIEGGDTIADDLGDRVSRQYRAWYDKLIQIVRYAMPPTCGYLLVQSESLVGLFTCVFVKQTEFKNIRELAISTVKTGMGGRYGNKGAVIARMVVQDTSIVFVNSHLAAGQKHVKQRNADVADILEYPTVFQDAHADPAAYVGGGDGSMILDHELCFWAGDLNYRIDHSRETVLSAIGARKITPLLEQDQLRKELKQNPAFRLKDFSEAPISFLPTYKYDRGSYEWDTSEKNRIPAWCDRILFKSHHPERIRCLEYRRWEATISDHRPVTAIFEAKIKAADHSKRQQVLDELKSAWSSLEEKLLANAVVFYSDPQ